MRGRILFVSAALCIAFIGTCTGCGSRKQIDTTPMMGLSWFASCDDVKNELDSYTLLSVRESEENDFRQQMLDYSGPELYDMRCDLTLCFTDSGLIGFNYHDVEKHQNYREWYQELENDYGVPTEAGSGMASWYADPLGKNTAVYLFNLQEGVQVSFYATADSPDQGYKKQRAVVTPEIRTPVIPVSEETVITTVSSSNTEAVSHGSLRAGGFGSSAHTTAASERVTEPDLTETTEASAITSDSDAGITNDSTDAKTTAASETEQTGEQNKPPVDEKAAFQLDGLAFYCTPEDGRQVMQSYTQLYEYRTEEPGEPWEHIMEYENVLFLGRYCSTVLCFTSLGLVGINYFGSNSADYIYWQEKLTGIYGMPDEKQNDYCIWNDPAGSGTVLYVFALEDGVQISFFTDDTGSERTGL